MSRIQEAFKGKKAFIPFVTCGDPDLETTKQIVYEMEKAGAALIELGIPFSDPTADICKCCVLLRNRKIS